MKHTVYQATFTPVEVEIPDYCPGCGADFSKTGALVEGNWQDCTVESHLEYPGASFAGTTSHDAQPPDVRLEAEGTTEYGETYYPSGVVCASCDWHVGPKGG